MDSLSVVAAALSAAVLLSTPCVTAQSSTVSPTHFAAVESPPSDVNTLGSLAPLARFLQIHEDLPAVTTPITGIAFRRNASSAAAAAFTVELDLRVSRPNATAAAPSSTFAANHGRFGAQVVSRRLVQFPASPSPRALPLPFEYEIPFDSPFVAPTAICWEMKVYSRTNAAVIPFDVVSAPQGDANPLAAVLTYGVGCVATGRSQPMATNGVFVRDWATNTLQINFGCTEAPSRAVCVAALGFQNSSWAGAPLPLEIPGSSGGSSGACFVHNDLFTTFAGQSGTTGFYATPLIALPLLPEYHGMTFFHHVWAFDAAANAFGVVSSNGMARQVVAPYARPPVSRVIDPSSHATTGSVELGVGLITRFVY
ncbi:MAG: hypothetical protein AB7I19_16480 [Planctomycetota bacterium]